MQSAANARQIAKGLGHSIPMRSNCSFGLARDRKLMSPNPQSGIVTSQGVDGPFAGRPSFPTDNIQKLQNHSSLVPFRAKLSLRGRIPILSLFSHTTGIMCNKRSGACLDQSIIITILIPLMAILYRMITFENCILPSGHSHMTAARQSKCRWMQFYC